MVPYSEKMQRKTQSLSYAESGGVPPDAIPASVPMQRLNYVRLCIFKLCVLHSWILQLRPCF